MKTETQADKRKRAVAGIVGGIMILIGLVLAVTDVVIYVGEWPNERPVYLSGIGYPLFVIGLFSALTGLYFHLAEPRAPTMQEPEAGGKQAD